MTITQKCKRCGKRREHGLRRNGSAQAYCRQCQREYSKSHYETNKGSYNGRRLKHQRQRRQDGYKITNSAKDRPCVDCGVKYPTYVMQFDHRDPTTKNFTIATHVRNGGSLKALIAEIEKCDVVCANCHAERTHQQRNGTG